MSATIKEVTALSALCIYECILEEINPLNSSSSSAHEFWTGLQERIGAHALRQTAIDLAPLLDLAWEAVHPALFDDSYDWDFVPAVLNGAREQDSDNFLSWDSAQWIALALRLFAPEDTKANQGGSDEIANYQVELGSGEIVKANMSLPEAETLLCRCCNDGLDAYITSGK